MRRTVTWECELLSRGNLLWPRSPNTRPWPRTKVTWSIRRVPPASFSVLLIPCRVFGHWAGFNSALMVLTKHQLDQQEDLFWGPVPPFNRRVCSRQSPSGNRIPAREQTVCRSLRYWPCRFVWSRRFRVKEKPLSSRISRKRRYPQLIDKIQERESPRTPTHLRSKPGLYYHVLDWS